MKLHRCTGIFLVSSFCSFGFAQVPSDTSYDCLIEPSVSVDLGSAVRGIATAINIERGDRVSQGDSLVELDSRVEQATVALALAKSENTAELKSTEESMQLAKKRLVRFRGLYESNNVSKQQLEDAESEAVIAEMNWHRARENQISAELELDEAKAVLALRTITSPVSGVVVERLISSGELVTEDDPVLRLASLNPLHVELILPASEFGKVRPDSVAKVYPEMPAGTEFVGRVDIVDALIDAASGTFGVRVALPNPDYIVPAGLSCHVDFQANENIAADAHSNLNHSDDAIDQESDVFEVIAAGEQV